MIGNTQKKYGLILILFGLSIFFYGVYGSLPLEVYNPLVYDNCDTLTAHTWVLEGDASVGASLTVDASVKTEGSGSVRITPTSGITMYVSIRGSNSLVSTPVIRISLRSTTLLTTPYQLSIYAGGYFYGYSSFQLSQANTFENFEFDLSTSTTTTDPSGNLHPNLSNVQQVIILVNVASGYSIAGQSFYLDNIIVGTSSPSPTPTPTPSATPTPVPTPTPSASPGASPTPSPSVNNTSPSPTPTPSQNGASNGETSSEFPSNGLFMVAGMGICTVGVYQYKRKR